jgi:hypothetical protein
MCVCVCVFVHFIVYFPSARATWKYKYLEWTLNVSSYNKLKHFMAKIMIVYEKSKTQLNGQDLPVSKFEGKDRISRR